MADVSPAHDVFADTLQAYAQLNAPAPAASTAQDLPPSIAAQHIGKRHYLCDNGCTLRLTGHVMGQGCFGKVVSALWVAPPHAQGGSTACIVAVKKPKRARFCPPMLDAWGVLHRPAKDTPAFARAAQLCVENLEGEARGAHGQRAVLAASAVVRTPGKALLVMPHMAATVQSFCADLEPPLHEPLVWHLLPQLLVQLQAAAAHGANGDIKAGNTLMRGHTVALCDFGWATGDEARGYATGAQRFRAPEAFLPALRVPGAMAKADIYSLGLMLLITATGLRGRVLEKLLARAVHRERTGRTGMTSTAAVVAMGAWMTDAPGEGGPQTPEERALCRVLGLCFARISPALAHVHRGMLHPNPALRASAHQALASVQAAAPPCMPAELSTKLDEHARRVAVAVANAVKPVFKSI